MSDIAPGGMTVRELSRNLRVSPEKIRHWINRGELAAVNTAAALCGRPRWVILPDGLATFLRMRSGGPVATKPAPRRRRDAIDYFPD
jgi:hypothetical protein